jgi:hypothetical protein
VCHLGEETVKTARKSREFRRNSLTNIAARLIINDWPNPRLKGDIFDGTGWQLRRPRRATGTQNIHDSGDFEEETGEVFNATDFKHQGKSNSSDGHGVCGCRGFRGAGQRGD